MITTALKRGIAGEAEVDCAVAMMSRLNRKASETAQRHDVHAMTDITGFGLAGHGLEMAKLSGVDFDIAYRQIALLPGAEAFARQGVFPGRHGAQPRIFLAVG